MAAAPGVRALLNLHRSVASQCSFALLPVRLTPTCLPRRLCTVTPKSAEPKPVKRLENESLLENLSLMGVDVKKARQRHPGVLRKVVTNERGLAQFLQSKGASRTVVAGVISRFPRAVTRTADHLEQRWQLWRSIFKTDAEIVRILDRSPECFFRSSNNENLEKNLVFLTSLGLNADVLHRLLTTAPRTVSNSLERNRQMVGFLEDICAELGGKDPEQFAKAIVSRNHFILIQSTKSVKNNIDDLKAALKLSDCELLAFLQGAGAEILDLSNSYLEKNFKRFQRKMVSLGCQGSDIQKLVLSYPVVLYVRRDRLSTKLDRLLKGGITMKQILEKPKVLDYSTQNIRGRHWPRERVSYDFPDTGLNILDTSRKRFDAKMEKLAVSPDE
ncbi:transcription termination factor 1, mitochondrial-like [Centroberyx affinis]|uniref:transcription termination factor 1, mitochondrial-like n=1 Tax=Centroberyx affinis TaxID=166261 RepID=UPI003A5C3500